MKLVIQRVLGSSVSVAGEVVGSIGPGLLALVGIADTDTEEQVIKLAAKTAALRIFDDENSVMNRSLVDVGGEVLAVSQFTLLASTAKGSRPSYVHAAKGDKAQPLYDLYCDELGRIIGKKVEKGLFGADMQVELVNSGPVTIILEAD